MSLSTEQVRQMLAEFGIKAPQLRQPSGENCEDLTKIRPQPSISLDVTRAPKPTNFTAQPQRSVNGGPIRTKIPQEVLEELYDRFLRHAPESEQSDIIRVCFNIEKAHWFYIDNYCCDKDHSATCPNISQAEFFQIVFRQAPLETIAHYQADLSAVLEEFGAYKTNVPTYGACILNQQRDKVLLVLSFSNSYGFPKGKINQGESPVACAAREVEEEVGIDVRDRIDANEYLEIEKRTPRGKLYTRLYIVEGVEEQRRVAGPKMKGEVRKVVWWPIDELAEQVSANAARRGRFWAVEPFLEPLRQWLLQRTENNDNGHHDGHSVGHLQPPLHATLLKKISRTLEGNGYRNDHHNGHACDVVQAAPKDAFFDRPFAGKNGFVQQYQQSQQMRQPQQALYPPRPANGYPSTRRMRVRTSQN